MKGKFKFNKEAFINDNEYRQRVIDAGFEQVIKEADEVDEEIFKIASKNVIQNLRAFYALGMLDGINIMRKDALDVRSEFADLRESDLKRQLMDLETILDIMKMSTRDGVFKMDGDVLASFRFAVINSRINVENDLKQINGLVDLFNKE